MTRLLLRALTLCFVVLLWPAASHGQPDEPAAPDQAAVAEGSARFRKGVELFHEGNAEAALAEFRRAYEIAPSYAILYNIGQVQFELRDYAGALSAFEQYLADGGEQIKPERRTEVEGEIQKLQGRVARIDIVVDVEGAEITVDGAVVGTAPLDKPIVVSAGQRKISVSKDKLGRVDRRVEVAGGDSIRVELELAPSSPPASTAEPPPTRPPPSPPPPVAPAPEPSSRTGLWISLAVTGALTAGAVVFGVLALDAKSGFEDELDTYPTSTETIDERRTKLQTMAALTDALGAAAIVAGGVTLVVALTGGSDEPAAVSAEQPASLELAVRPTGLCLQGTF